MIKLYRDYSLEEVKDLCKNHNKEIKDFHKFMEGQTMYEEDGVTFYFCEDVERFINGTKRII